MPVLWSSKPDGSRHHGQRPPAPGIAVCTAVRRAVSSSRDPESWGRRCHSISRPLHGHSEAPAPGRPDCGSCFSHVNGHRGPSRDIRVLGTAEQGGGLGRPRGRKGILRVSSALSSDTLQTEQTPQLHGSATAQPTRRADGREQAWCRLLALLGLRQD
ncbi:hypothetical protein PAL_GLEAN10000144 [Pteropus alecto]|uniref:Uncharacterized protein n=1 Tax=Pteropus alecto TaxID=9402 RepID=L5KCA1_PTEAL|nr:hypothetical protein PAL_GLEAN10000144 [Pteropus alecto]